MTDASLRKEWESLLAKMVGQACWSMIGVSGGSMFSLDFGEKRRREVVVRNDKLRGEQRSFVGEYRLFARMTGWRLYQTEKCLCHCNNSNAKDGPMVMGLRQLEGKRLLHFESGKSPAELMLSFSKDYRLVLSDWEGADPEDEAYTLFGEERAVTVRMNGEIGLQRRE